MKNLILTFLAVMVFGAGVNAQNLETEVKSSKASLSACSSSLDATIEKMEQIKKETLAAFEQEQMAIDEMKAELKERRAEFEKGNSLEATMSYNKWPARLAAKERLIYDEQAADRLQYILNNKISNFNYRMEQVEQQIMAYSVDIKQTTNVHNSKVQSYYNRLGNFMK